ncbi:TPA: hypothetical protein N0F65_012513 [Lagenidium giganteum]|uniref:Glycoside hydrolase family 5 domain-containing protein n=1 Tax=Lagenidium giganteum TaxID=4803 RepID=A0AAV2YER1_9STRA|nr:TPA: hypothetical protein N0F65_012513 [Lagenidium giganteum]
MDNRQAAAGGRPSSSGPRNSEVERIIAAAEVDTTFAGKKARYRGRRSTWPGALGLFLVLVGSVVGLTYYGIKVHKDVKDTPASDAAIKNMYGSGHKIDDGRSGSGGEEDIDVVNPETFKDRKCEQPNYVSKNGKIVAVFKGGKEVTLTIKGANWFGMQDAKGVPKGLWDGPRDGSTIYRIGQFLKGNNFNAVRFPLSIDSAARNIEPASNLVNTNSNRALEPSRYNKLLASLVQGLGQFGIGVVLDFHVLSAVAKEDKDGLWTGTSVQLPDIKLAIKNLATAMCDSKHFNVIGIDLKNFEDGTKATWGDGSNTDWAAAATEIGDYVVDQCPKWLAFVQGVQGTSRKDTYSGDRSIKYKYWAGSDFSNVKKSPIKLATDNKVVYAPKFFTNSMLPQLFFFDNKASSGGMLADYVESDDKTLTNNTQAAMDYMFGDTFDTGAAVVLSSFGGLTMDEDKTKKQTSTRIISIIVDKILASKKPLAGGFWHELNPDTIWAYTAPDDANTTLSGLVDSSWRAANQNPLTALKKLDDSVINFIPCEK